MLRLCFASLASTFLLSTTALAHGFGFPLCGQFSFNPQWCNQQPNCAWDDDDRRCEPLNQPVYCAQWDNNPRMCQMMFICSFDVNEGRCEQRF